jgi:DNA-binding CsgD family transcriptional regulator
MRVGRDSSRSLSRKLALGVIVCGFCFLPIVEADANALPVIDLRETDFSDGSLTPLDGEWAIYWRRLLETREFAKGALPTPDDTFLMPATWNDWIHEGAPVGGIGYATFAVRVILPEGLDQGSLRIPNASTAYKLSGNGALLAQSGIPGRTRDSTTPRYRIRAPRFSASEGELLLLLQVSNFHHRRGGMWRPLEIGTVSAVDSKETMEITYDLLLIGSFAAMAFYNLLLYYLNGRRSRGALYLALLFAILVFRTPMMGQMIITRMFPTFPWALQLRIEYVTAQLALLGITCTLREIYPSIISKRFTVGVTAFVALNVAVVLLGPVYFYSLLVKYFVYTMILLLLYETLRLGIALVRGHRAAWYGIGAAAITLLITLGETIHYQELILSRDFAPFGFLITLLAGDSVNQTTTYMISAAVNLLFLFLVASLLALRGSQALLSMATGAAVPVEPPAQKDPTERQEQFKKLYGISKRESEIIRLVADGMSNKQIAAELYISETTVKSHMYRILRKTGVGNRTELGRAYYLGQSPQD